MTTIISQSNFAEEDKLQPLVAPQAAPRKYELVYFRTFVIIYLHLAAFYGLFGCIGHSSWATLFFCYLTFVIANIGITGGVHRLWSHKAFKAKLPLQIIFMLFQCMAHQVDIISWASDHRMHHKYTDTDADPHNSTRGFFFVHIGWAFVKKHPEMVKRQKFIDVTDLYSNPVLMFQRRYWFILMILCSYVLPFIIPVLLWGESLSVTWHLNMLRYTMNLNAIFLINSAAHRWGNKPYDKTIIPVENKFVSFLTLGEGFHNYHHTFPWDYRAAELGNDMLNWTTIFINLCARIGWAYDMKTVSDEVIIARCKRTGDGSKL